jgi:hypothetical protein
LYTKGKNHAVVFRKFKPEIEEPRNLVLSRESSLEKNNLLASEQAPVHPGSEGFLGQRISSIAQLVACQREGRQADKAAIS